jgi:predicted patatin/cPLA2 family phospholipase
VVTLVFEGGAMRGAYGSGVALALQEAGLVPDAIYGTSAGGAIAAWYAAGQAHVGVTTWERVGDRQLLSYRRALWGDRPVLDFRLLYGDMYPNLFRMDVARLRAAPYPVYVTLTDADSAETALADLRAAEDPFLLLHATSALPLVSEAPVSIGGRRYLDGGATAPLPLQQALDAGRKDLLVVSNRPRGLRRPESPLLVAMITRRFPALGDAARRHHAIHNESIALAEALSEGRAPPRHRDVKLRLVRPSKDLGLSRFTRDLKRIRAAIAQGRADGQRVAAEMGLKVPA